MNGIIPFYGKNTLYVSIWACGYAYAYAVCKKTGRICSKPLENRIIRKLMGGIEWHWRDFTLFQKYIFCYITMD